MLASHLSTFVDAASKFDEIGVVVRSIESGNEIAITFDLEIDTNEYGDLLICIAI